MIFIAVFPLSADGGRGRRPGLTSFPRGAKAAGALAVSSNSSTGVRGRHGPRAPPPVGQCGPRRYGIGGPGQVHKPPPISPGSRCR